MASRRLEDLRPEFRSAAARVYERANSEIAATLSRPISAIITMTKREESDQAALYAKGRTVMGELCNRAVCQDCSPGGHGHTVTNAKPGWSYHEKGLAMDIMLLDNGKIIKRIEDPAWEAFGNIVESEGLCWGGKWIRQDGPHVEKHPPGLGCRDAGKIKPVEIA